MFSIPQSTSFTAVFKAYQSSDHVTEATGKTIAITLSKAGGAFGNPNAGATNATEISGGWYKVSLDTADTGTLGILALRGTSSGIDDIGDRFIVEARPANFASLSIDGSGRVDVAKIAGTSQTARDIGASVLVGDKTGFSLTQSFPANFAALGIGAGGHILTVDTLTTYTGNTPQTGDTYALIGAAGAGLTALGDARVAHLDADVSSRLAGVSYAAPDNASISAIKAATDNLPSDPADQSLVMAATSAILDRIGAPAGLSVAADIAAVKTDTGTDIPADIAALSIPTAAEIRSEIDANSTKLDAAVSSRLAATNYSAAPSANDNADALLDRADAIETGVTLRQALRLKLAVLVGKLSGAGTGTETFRNGVADSKGRVTATVDSNGNRTAITTDAT